MVGIILTKKIPLLDKNTNSYNAITSDEKHVYIVSSKCRIVAVYDFDFNFIRYCTLINAYTDLCYDNVEQCFWAVGNTNKIYKLDRTNFCEIDAIPVTMHSHCKMQHIAFLREVNGFAVTSNSGSIVVLNKQGDRINEYIGSKQAYMQALGTFCNQIVAVESYHGNTTSIIKLIGSNLQDENIGCLPKNFTAKSMFGYLKNNEQRFFVLANKNHLYNYIMQYRFICSD